jgi:hypothetical protein
MYTAMTALKPAESRLVTGVAAERYPLNDICAHPGCKEPAMDPHHLWPRSSIGNTSWFVSIEGSEPIPHVTGLCRTHHDDLEEHRAWVRLEDGIFNWYVRGGDDWVFRGKLNPQPPGQETKPKRNRAKRKLSDEERRSQRTVTLRVPAEAKEDGRGLLEDAIGQAEERLGHREPRSPYYTIMDSLNLVILHGAE